MILVDILSYNLTNALMFTTPLMVYDLNDKRLYITLIFDVILNGIPFCTITLLLLYFFNKWIIRYISDGMLYLLVSSIFFLIIYAVVIFSVFNKFSMIILKLILKTLPVNILFNAGVIFLKRGHKLN